MDGGKIYRLNKDGSIPDSNPFYNTIDAKKAIWSYGHRNPQGIIRGLNEEEIWVHEHGPRGGDEINIIKNPIKGEDGLKDRNYGWPKATYGINYSGSEITKFQKMNDVIDPFYYWTPSIAPSDMIFYENDVYPELRDSFLVTALVSRDVKKVIFNESSNNQESLFSELGMRLRNIQDSPKGIIYLLTDGPNGKLIKVIPKSL